MCIRDRYSFTDKTAVELAWAGALMLLIIVMALNIIGRIVRHYFSPKGNR